MKDMSLKYYPRANKLSNSERLFISDFNIINKNKIANQRLEAFAVFMLLKMAMGENSESGFFLKADEKQLRLLASENLYGIDTKFLDRVLESCFNQGLFDRVLYEKFNILTSPDIQDEYFFSDNVKRRALKDISNYKDYVYGFIWDKLKIAGGSNKIASNKTKIASNFRETKQNETQTQTREIQEPEHDSFGNSLSEFKSKFPSKMCDEILNIPSNVNLELLAKNILESEFLMKAANLNWSWCVKHYSDIVKGNYKNFSKSTSDSKKDKKFIKHDYSDKNLNELFDDLDKIEL